MMRFFLQSRDNLSDVASPAQALANLGGLGLQAATPLAGFALQNATPTILTWTTPNDGKLHRYMIAVEVDVSSAQTGGQVDLQGTLPSGLLYYWGIAPGGSAVGYLYNIQGLIRIAGPGTTVSIYQSTAQTAGQATLWAEIWGL